MHDERERRLANQETHWRVNIDPQLLEQAVREFALQLLDTAPGRQAGLQGTDNSILIGLVEYAANRRRIAREEGQ